MIRRPGGMTLIETLVASTLGVVLIAMTWTAFLHAKNTTERTRSLVGLHETAGIIQETFANDFATMAPALAMFVISTPTVSGSTRSEQVDLVFMRSTAPLDKQASESTYDRYLADHHWVRWRFVRTLEQSGPTWTITAASLRRSTSTPIRHWKTTAALVPPAPVWDPLGSGTWRSSYNGVNWINIPRPLRDAGGGVASLDANRYGVPATAISADTPIGDIGDLTDLDANERILSRDVRDFSFGWVAMDGGSVTVTSDLAATHQINGLYLDVVGPDNGRYLDARQDPSGGSGPPLVAGIPQYDYRPDLSRRPRLVRIAFRLEDGDTPATQVFAFSVATPGLMPVVSPP